MKVSEMFVGQRVRRMTGPNNPDYPVGSECTVGKLRDSYHFAPEGRLELLASCNYEPAEPNQVPEVPFGDLTAEQKITLVSAGIRGEALECRVQSSDTWREKSTLSSSGSLDHFGSAVVYRVKPKETPEEAEIKAIREQMQTLTDRLAKLENK